MITFTFDAEKVIAALAERRAKVTQGLAAAVTTLALKLQAKAIQRAPVLTGKLRRSIFQQTEITQDKAIGRVLVSPDTAYARIQEYGGTTSPHDIYPSAGKALAFQIGPETIFARHVRHPGSVIPAVNYLHGAFDEMKPEIIATLETAVSKAIKNQ